MASATPSIIEIAQAYDDALAIVTPKRQAAANLTPVWTKLNHVTKYLESQAALELAEVLGGAA